MHTILSIGCRSVIVECQILVDIACSTCLQLLLLLNTKTTQGKRNAIFLFHNFVFVGFFFGVPLTFRAVSYKYGICFIERFSCLVIGKGLCKLIVFISYEPYDKSFECNAQLALFHHQQFYLLHSQHIYLRFLYSIKHRN